MSTTAAPPPPRAPSPTPATRAPAPASTPPSRPPAQPPAPALLSVHIARLIGFVALAALAALQWAQMVRPAASDAVLACVVASAVAGWWLSAVARREPPARVRAGATLLTALVLLLVAFLVAGVPLRFLGPRGWDELGGGIAQGVGAVASVSTPYSGLDEWTRIVIVLGGCALVGLAALVAFAPRRGGVFGVPGAAAVVLGVLYTVPVMQHDLRLPYFAGLLFVLLLATFLWLERVERRSAGVAAALVAVAALAGYVAAPRLDGERALLDYEELAQSLSAAKTTQYSWNHDYGPLDWPRDGREVLRIQARRRSYWKAVNLVAFDGTRWVQDTGQAPDGQERTTYNDDWKMEMRVTLRALRTSQFITAGTALDMLKTPRTAMNIVPGVYETTREPLRRGHSYRALVYVPRPTAAQMRRGTDYLGVQAGYGVVRLPGAAAGGRGTTAGARGSSRDAGRTVSFPFWSREGMAAPVLNPGGADATAIVERSLYGPVYALAKRLRDGTSNPLEYVQAIERYLAGEDFSYSERPPPSRTPLADFLLEDHTGFCQQFSGAMALLLRMGGVPARVASGFAPGVYDKERREYVVRDVDAHSWVEFYVPNAGWVARDPTPADSPARSQMADFATGNGGGTAAFGGSERALGRFPAGGPGALPAAAAQDEGTSPLTYIGAGLGALAVGGALAAYGLGRRRRRREAGAGGELDPDLAELHRALHRSRRTAPPGMTLDALALRLAGTPAQAYVQTLADARYGYGERAPTRAERAALREELGAGLGLGGRVRAWWALPPRLPPRRR